MTRSNPNLSIISSSVYAGFASFALAITAFRHCWGESFPKSTFIGGGVFHKGLKLVSAGVGRYFSGSLFKSSTAFVGVVPPKDLTEEKTKN